MKFNRRNICEDCPLKTMGTGLVWGTGNYPNDVMIIGRDPGRNEVKKGEPFVGRSGTLLNMCLNRYTNFNRDNVYITNIVKCRRKGNKPPTKEIINNCKIFLNNEISKAKPKLIIPLGKLASEWFLGSIGILGKKVGHIYTMNNSIKIIPMYHPSYILRTGKQRSFRLKFEGIYQYYIKNIKVNNNEQ